MARYRLLLHHGSTTAPVTEVIDVDSDDDAKDIARISLLMTQAYTHAKVYRDDALVATYKRDSYAD